MRTRALAFALRGQYSSSSGASGLGTGLKTNLNYAEGTEAVRYPGGRHDTPEWFRKMAIWQLQRDYVPQVGMLWNDRWPVDQARRGWSLRMKGRLSPGDMQQHLFRVLRGQQYDLGQYVLPLDQQPNIDADHYFLENEYKSQIVCEYEEESMVEAVTGDSLDVWHQLSLWGWFYPTRLPQIMAHKKKQEGETTLNPVTGQLERNDTMASSFLREAF